MAEGKKHVLYELNGQRYQRPVTLIEGYTDESRIPNILAVAHGVKPEDIHVIKHWWHGA